MSWISPTRPFEANRSNRNSFSWYDLQPIANTIIPKPVQSELKSLALDSLGEIFSGQNIWDNIGSGIGKLWNLPNTLIGLVWGGFGALFGADVGLGHNAIEFTNHPFVTSGITLGNTISYGTERNPTDTDVKPIGGILYETEHKVGDHEEQHTFQGEILGPLYLPANLIGGTLGLIFDQDWHGPSNFMEAGPMGDPPSLF